MTIDVKNTGQRGGDEVVQLYVHQQASSVKRPVKELRGFRRIALQPGETKTVTLEVPGDKLAFYDEKIHAFRVEPGIFDVMAGAIVGGHSGKGPGGGCCAGVIPFRFP